MTNNNKDNLGLYLLIAFFAWIFYITPARAVWYFLEMEDIIDITFWRAVRDVILSTIFWYILWKTSTQIKIIVTTIVFIIFVYIALINPNPLYKKYCDKQIRDREIERQQERQQEKQKQLTKP